MDFLDMGPDQELAFRALESRREHMFSGVFNDDLTRMLVDDFTKFS